MNKSPSSSYGSGSQTMKILENVFKNPYAKDKYDIKI